MRIIVWLAAYPLTGVEMLPGENAQDGQSLPRAVESIVQAEQELKYQINICATLRREVVAAIGRVPDDLDQDILRRRFLDD